MNERIKELRKHLNMNQTDFGARIGVKQGTIAGYENGIRVPLDAVVTSICKEFGVSETWLRTGEGEMFADARDDFELITRAMAGTSEGKKRVMRIIAGMPDELLDKILDYLETKK